MFINFLITGLAMANENVAKAIISRGSVIATTKEGKTIKVDKGTWLSEGTKVTTSKASFVKFLFADKSQVNLGPNSEMEIAKFDKQEAGIINLMKGSLRSKVTKNYMEEAQAKSKLFVKTKSAAMGVRGTDFMVEFNPISNVTNLDVISGQVALAPLADPSIANSISRTILENLVSGESSVLVNKGESSKASQGMKRAAAPKPIPPAKLEKLKKVIIPKTVKTKNDPLKVFKVGKTIVKTLVKEAINQGGELPPAPVREPASADTATAEPMVNPDGTIQEPILTPDGTMTNVDEGSYIDPRQETLESEPLLQETFEDSGTFSEAGTITEEPPPPPPPLIVDDSAAGISSGGTTTDGQVEVVEDPCTIDPEACTSTVIEPPPLDPCANGACGGGTHTNVTGTLNQVD